MPNVYGVAVNTLISFVGGRFWRGWSVVLLFGSLYPVRAELVEALSLFKRK
jgi:hypothetical protein